MMVQSLEEVRRFGEAAGWDWFSPETATPGALVNEILGLAPDFRVKVSDRGVGEGSRKEWSSAK